MDSTLVQLLQARHQKLVQLCQNQSKARSQELQRVAKKELNMAQAFWKEAIPISVEVDAEVFQKAFPVKIKLSPDVENWVKEGVDAHKSATAGPSSSTAITPVTSIDGSIAKIPPSDVEPDL